MWEIPVAAWGSLRDSVRSILVRVAKARDGFITYTDLVNETGYFKGPESHALAEILGEICARDHPAPMLSSLVVYRDYSGPGMGFFRMAKLLERLDDISNDAVRDKFWLEEVKRCREHYRHV